MKKIFLSLIIILTISPVIFSQTPFIEVYNPPIPLGISNPDWSYGDFIVSTTEPFGRPSGVYRASNSSVYVAVPDTNIITNRCLVVLRSTDDGKNWVIGSSVGPTGIISKAKFVDAGSDSIYCFFRLGPLIYCWNIVTNNLNQFTAYTNIRDFDATSSSTHSLYLSLDILGNNDIRIYGSINGGSSWIGGIYVSSVGAVPRISMSGTGDTCILNYYATLTADTGSSLIRNFRWRETSPGTLTSMGFTDPIAAGVFKDQFQPVIYGGKVWLFYTTGTTGNINLNCIQSNDNGATYGSPITIGSLPSRDEYWFDARYYTYGTGGIDLIYYSDSIASPSSNVTDRLYYTYFSLITPTTYETPVQISEHWPFWSGRLYIPSLIEYFNAVGDMGAIWVGGPSPYKLYFDGYHITTRTTNNHSEVPIVYNLSQNYPNPFNPMTKIDYTIPKNGIVTLKIYDILGKEIETLINKEMNAGSYSIEFNAAKLSSGIYFYKLISGNFTQTRKMILVK